MPPKIGLSDSIRWIRKNNKIYVPFIEIIGYGEKQANRYAQSKPLSEPRLKGFFGKKYTVPPKEKSKNELILDELKVHDPDTIPDDEILSKHFSLDIGKTNTTYDTLCKILGFSFSKNELPKWKTLDIPRNQIPYGLIQRLRFSNDKLLRCERCELRNECDNPVMPSLGFYNVVICGEGPGPQENKYQRGFFEKAPAGNLLWKELKMYNLSRRMFHVTNIVKCYPSKTKTPKTEHIKTRAHWLSEEFDRLQTRLILAFGNTGVQALTGREGGITNLSGTTEWISSILAWVCWCLHPAAVKRKESNLQYFEKGIKNFAEKFELLKGDK
jgi:DNA polymerase